MKMITIAWDVDGTLRDDTMDQNEAPKANESIRSMLIHLAKFDNVLTHVWTANPGGEQYARDTVAALGLASYVDSYGVKVREDLGIHMPTADFQPDISIDNIPTTELGIVNLIYGSGSKADVSKS